MLTASPFVRATHQIEWAGKVAAGLKRHGVRILERHDPTADIRIVWGARSMASLPPGGRALVLERAYLGDRFSWTAIGWDGINGRADFCNADVPDDRWRRYWEPEVKPEERGAGCLVVGQVNGDASLEGANVGAWAAEIARSKPVRYRPHPEAMRRNQHQALKADPTDLAELLRVVDVVHTYTSNVGVLAAMAGKRVTCETPMSMVREIAGHGWHSDNPLGDRHDWGRKLAYCQWTPDELVAGEFWQTLSRGVE